MHETFLAKLQPHLVRDPDGTTRYDIDPVQAAKLGSYVNPPKDPDKPVADVAVANVPRTLSLASAESKPAPRPAQSESTSTLGRLSRWVGLTSDEPKQEAPKASPAPAPKGAAARPSAAAGIAAKPSSAQEANAEPPALRTTSAGGASLMSGATAPVPSDSFENRFGR
jgi:hypothetical protein